MKFNKKEIKILAIFIAVWGLFFIGSGIVMKSNKKITKKTNYKLVVKKSKKSQAQAKKIEVILKDIEIEINNPISVNVKDYLVDGDKIDDKIIKQLELDTSLVNISQAGTYTYTIKYNKKKYQGKIKVKEKELPDMTFTLKEITLYIGEAIPKDKKAFINEQLPDEIYEKITMEIPTIDTSVQNDYKYYAIYKNTRYDGIIRIREKGIIEITKTTCPDDSTLDENENTCKCNDTKKTYDTESKTCQ